MPDYIKCQRDTTWLWQQYQVPAFIWYLVPSIASDMTSHVYGGQNTFYKSSNLTLANRDIDRAYARIPIECNYKLHGIVK